MTMPPAALGYRLVRPMVTDATWRAPAGEGQKTIERRATRQVGEERMKRYPRRDLSLADFERLLAQEGYELTRISGHRIYHHRETAQLVTVTAHGGRVVSKEIVENVMSEIEQKRRAWAERGVG
jgi:predicted RNA binding protein YcfA (HicA-like mRNA interferase family)